MLKQRIVWGSVIFGLLAVFAATYFLLVVTRPADVNAQNCRLDSILPAHTVVIIDQSDPFSPADVEYSTALIYQEAEALAKYGRLTVLAIDENNPNEAISVFSRCSPGSPSQANPLFENRGFIASDWSLRFERDMKQEVISTMERNNASTSPLLETLRGVLRRFDFSETVPDRRIVLISDMYQNSEAYSMYRSGLSQSGFDAAIQQIEMPSFSGVEIALFRADRETSLRGEDLVEFWTANLSAMQASSIDVIRD